jgi:hypothetical protein
MAGQDRRGGKRRARPAAPSAHRSGDRSRHIDAILHQQRDWRGDTLTRLRALILQADPAITEEVKWRKPSNPAGVPVWSHDGIVCTANILKSSVRVTFMKGAALDGKTGLYNASLAGNRMRAVDFFEGEAIDEEAFKDLVRAAVALNGGGK